MKSLPFRFFAVLLSLAPLAQAQEAPPRDNPYDVIAKIFQPIWGVLLAETKSPNRAATLTLEMTDVTGRLPGAMKGAALKAAVQFPDKVRLEAPVMGEQFTVCRNGNEVWATPGKKVEFLVSQFQVKPKKNVKLTTPIFLPITAQQAIFLPALFAISRPDVAEVETVGGEDCRVLTAGLMPELARATKAEDFQGRVWVAAGYVPRRMEITRQDFTAVVDIKDLRFVPSLPASTWEPPAGVTDVYRTTPEMLEGLLFVVMNSLKTTEADAPWLKAK
jgi:outer membrane lipoprotein-sorting protein